MKAKVTKYLNERVKQPSVNATNPKYYKPGDDITIVDIIKGDEYDGNKIWYKLDNGAYVWSGGVDTLIDVAIRPDSLVDFHLPFKDPYPLPSQSNIGILALDTGIEIHEDLSHVTSRLNFLDPNEYPRDDDLNGHGTHITGLIGSNASKNGIRGVFPTSKIHFGKVKNRSSSLDEFSNALINAFKWVLESNENIHIISISQRITESFWNSNEIIANETVELLSDLHTKGIKIVAAAGDNKQLKKNYYPSALEDYCISVGSVLHGFFDNFNLEKHLDIVTSYTPYTSTCNEQNRYFKELKGCSMSSALISGVISLFLHNKLKDGTPLTSISKQDVLIELKKYHHPIKDLNYSDSTTFRYHVLNN